MSQITRCPACATMFKVGAGQFEAAQGWVRCGCCGEVFDAAQHLVPTDVAALKDDAVSVVPEEALEVLPAPAVAPEPAPQDQPEQSDKPEPVGVSSALLDSRQPLQAGPTPLQPLPAEILLQDADAPSQPVMPAGAEAVPAAPQEEESAPAASSLTQAAEAQTDVQTEAVAEATAVDVDVDVTDTSPDIGDFPPVAALTPSVEAPTEVTAEAVAVETNPVITPLALLEPVAPASVSEPEPEPEPALTPAPELSFVRDARRKAFWQRPLVRVLLGLVFLLLLTALLLQWVLQQKDNLAATDPRLAPFLQALCGPLHCTIRPPRRIESLLIDSSSFRKTGPDLYSLSFVLKNNSAAVLEMPSLEVTLTDVQEQALVRRVLAPKEFGATTAALAAHGELAGVITLKVAGEPVPGAPLVPPLPVTGYRVVAFYP